MIVNGGLDHNDSPLQDLWSYNLEHFKWSSMSVEKYIPALSHHTATLVMNHPFKYYNFYKSPKIDKYSQNDPEVKKKFVKKN